VPILPRFLPPVHCYLLWKYRFTPTSYVYIHIDREQLTHEARMPSDLSLLQGSDAFSARQPGRAVLTCGDLTHGKDGGDRE
jgi:hypothetical protein